MAQANAKQVDLKKGLLRVRLPTVGMKHYPIDLFADALKHNILNDTYTSVLDIPFVKELVSYRSQLWQPHGQGIFRRFFENINEPPFEFQEVVMSGSIKEGLFIHDSGHRLDKPDIDFMCTIKNISFSEQDQVCGSLDVKEETPFVNAYITKPELLSLWKDFLEDPDKDREERRLSARKLKSKLFEIYQKADGRLLPFLYCLKSKPIGDGPSLEVHSGEFARRKDVDNFLLAMVEYLGCRFSASGKHSDIVLAIPCQGWPRCSSEWLERERFWPDKDLIGKIAQQGFHIVPKSSTEGDFRLSFSEAEFSLVENLTSLQRKVFLAFKAIIKYHEKEWSPNIKDIICSYHIKTVALWHMEKYPQASWTEDNVVGHLLSLLQEFADALRKRSLPMYFLPKYNLLRNVGTAEEMRKISDHLMKLSKDLTSITTVVKKLENERTHLFILSNVIEVFENPESKKDGAIFPPLD